MSPTSHGSEAVVQAAVELQGHVSQAMHELSEAFGKAIDAKDHCTKNHSEEVAVVSHMLALAMGLSPFEADVIHIAGHLHDVGKIGVPDAVLSKPGPLDTMEWRFVMRHPETGAEILRPVKDVARLGIPEIVLAHHERWDGKGYPNRLKGEGIPLGARIIAVADSLSAMMQNRPYRCARSFLDAAAEIELCSGGRYDPRVVEAFRRIKGEIEQTLKLCIED